MPKFTKFHSKAIISFCRSKLMLNKRINNVVGVLDKFSQRHVWCKYGSFFSQMFTCFLTIFSLWFNRWEEQTDTQYANSSTVLKENNKIEQMDGKLYIRNQSIGNVVQVKTFCCYWNVVVTCCCSTISLHRLWISIAQL